MRRTEFYTIERNATTCEHLSLARPSTHLRLFSDATLYEPLQVLLGTGLPEHFDAQFVHPVAWIVGLAWARPSLT